MTAILLSAFLTSAVGMTLLTPVLRRAGVLDIPNARSSHGTPTPRGGGIAVVVGIAIGSVIAVSRGLSPDWWIIGGVIAFSIVGLADDLLDLPVTGRLSAQLVLAAGVAAAALVRDESSSAWVTIGLAFAGICWLVGYTNAFNFMDGVNGMAAVNAIIAGCWFLYLGVDAGLDGLAALGAAVAGSAAGFLPWNSPRARVFLGDVGSYALGFAIAGLTLLACVSGISPLAAATPLLIYLADTSYTLARRIIRGSSWREAHREHVYQRLTDRGFSHLGTTAICGAAALTLCAWQVVVDYADVVTPIRVLGMAVVVCGYLCLPNVSVPLYDRGWAPDQVASRHWGDA